MFERFTDRARRVLVLAQDEARLLHHNYIGTEHLLLGLTGVTDGLAAQALGALDVRLQDVRHAVQEAVGKRVGQPRPTGTGSPPFTPRAKKVLELSLREALALGHNYIGTEHLLLALVREGEGLAARVLTSLGVDLERAREQVIALLGEQPDRRGHPVGGVGGSVAAPQGPFCSWCRSDLRETARHRTIEAPAEAGELRDQPVRVVVVYCSRCGTHLWVNGPAG